MQTVNIAKYELVKIVKKNREIHQAEYDKKTNQPHCEMEEKIALIKKVAETVGVDLEEVFGK